MAQVFFPMIATPDEILEAQVISYNFLKSGCINRELVNSEDEWIFPTEISQKDEDKINFALKVESILIESSSIKYGKLLIVTFSQIVLLQSPSALTK